jgi:hypothetical protein
MGKSIDKLLSIASHSVGPRELDAEVAPIEGWDTSGLWELLALRNGFYAFESALHVLPWKSDAVMDIDRWNALELWKADYEGAADALRCFAEDAPGDQFALSDAGIVRLNPETTETTFLAGSIEEWAGVIVEDDRWLTGWPLAHDWQSRDGPLPTGKRLVPVIPFILGGEYAVENLVALDATEGMRLRADMWRQTHDLPRGSRVRIRLEDD